MVFYWLWVHFTWSGNIYHLTHQPNSEEREKIGARLKERLKEYCAMIFVGLLSIIGMIAVCVYGSK